jgi:alpha-beta hydrolase superfamily lysophospholipase
MSCPEPTAVADGHVMVLAGKVGPSYSSVTITGDRVVDYPRSSCPLLDWSFLQPTDSMLRITMRFVVVFGVAFLLGSGCAPMPVAVDGAAPERSLPPGANAADASIREYLAADGRRLGYTAYDADEANTALIYLHGLESHEGWFALAASRLRDRGFDIYALDRRGSGINRENRGFRSGHVDDYATLLSDIHTFVGSIRDRYAAVFVVGLSWGGKLALAYGLTYPDELQGLVLITPGLRSLVDLSLGQKLRVAAFQGLQPTVAIPTPIEPRMFTTTPDYLGYIQNDPLRLRYASARFFWQSRLLDRYVDERMSSNVLPIQLFLAGRDRIIDNGGVEQLIAIGSQPTRIERYADQTHSIQLDASERLADDITEWIKIRLREQ